MSGLLIILEYLCILNTSSSTFDNYSTELYTNSSTVVYSFDGDFPCMQPPISMCMTLESTEECAGKLLLCVSTIPEENTTAALCSPCAPGTYGSSEDNCSACTPGFHSPDPGSTNCLECAVGEFAPEYESSSCINCSAGAYASDPGSSACVYCTDGIDFAVNNSCTNCTTECPPGNELHGVCTAANNSYCAPCTPVANCIFAGVCGNSSFPNCECVAGFELVDGECRVCREGFFKNHTNPFPCEEWDLLTCLRGYHPVNGTRFHNSVCVPCPEIPDNSTFTSEECGWGCDAGFNNTI
jgi:hypothetical protein